MRKYGTKNKIRAKDHGNNKNGERAQNLVLFSVDVSMKVLSACVSLK